MAGLDRKTLRKIAKDAFIDNLYNIARAKGYDMKKLVEIAKLAKQHFDKRLVCNLVDSKKISGQARKFGYKNKITILRGPLCKLLGVP